MFLVERLAVIPNKLLLKLNNYFFKLDETSLPVLAGSGGRLVLDINTNISQLNFSVDGGGIHLPDMENLKCLRAAPGTAYNYRMKTLIVRRRITPDNDFFSNDTTVLKANLSVTDFIADGPLWLTTDTSTENSFKCFEFCLA